MVFKAQKRVGTLLAGRYLLDSLLSEGGMGACYAATHRRTGRRVAVKLLRAPEGDDAMGQRLELEARAAAQLEHPNVVDVLDMGEDEDGVPFIAMELLQGEPLSRALERQGALSVEATLRWLLPVMGALAVAHDQGVLHRDLKPENLYLARTRDGKVVPKLLDFGIAKASGQPSLTNSGVVVGTPAYMSPEQARSDTLHAATDVWSMGVVFFECLTGRMPFVGDGITGVLLKIVSERAPLVTDLAPKVPRRLAAAVDEALEREPAKRYRDMRSFARALLEAATEDGVPLPEDPDPVGLPTWLAWRAEAPDITGTAPMAPPPEQMAPPPERQAATSDASDPAPSRRWPLVALAGALLVALAFALWPWAEPPDGDGLDTPKDVVLPAAKPVPTNPPRAVAAPQPVHATNAPTPAPQTPEPEQVAAQPSRSRPKAARPRRAPERTPRSAPKPAPSPSREGMLRLESTR